MRLALLLPGFAAAGACLALADARPPAVDRMPEITVDSTPLARGNRPVVASYADALEEVRGCVVSISSSRIVRRPEGMPVDDPHFRRFFEDRVQRGLGSGVIVSTDGYILTNNHVIEGSDTVRVGLPGGGEREARIVGGDPRTDVAVLKIEAAGLRHATLADSDGIRVGDVVFAVGNPLGIGQTTTMGIISATGRSNLQLIDQGYENFIQTDASINPGNSGGALVDTQGRVVGINTAILATSRGNIGIGFAIPVNLAANIMRSLIETGTVARGFLGVNLRDFADGLVPEDFGIAPGRGVVVRGVQPESPADRVGLRQGDVILAVGERSVKSASELRLVISQMSPGTRTVVTFSREGREETIEVELGRLQEQTDFSGGPPDQLVDGIRIALITPELRQQFEIAAEAEGVVVIEANERSRFATLLPAGCVIERINRQAVLDVGTARAAIVRGRNILLVNQRGAFRYVPITVD